MFFFLILSVFSELATAGDMIRLKAGTLSGEESSVREFVAKNEPGLYIVQWNRAVFEADKAALRAAGVEPIQYIPDNAFLVNVREGATLDGFSFLRVVVPYRPEYRMEPSLSKPGIFDFEKRTQVIVQLLPGATASGELSGLVHVSGDTYFAEIKHGEVWSLARNSQVVWIERFLPFSTMEWNPGSLDVSSNDVRTLAPTGYESGTKVIGVDAMYSRGITGAGQIAAFADTGLDSGDINSLIADFQGQVKSGWALGLWGTSWGDPHNHGTHVAGSIAGNGKSSNGGIRGAAFAARLVAEGLWSDVLNNISLPSIDKLFSQANSEGARIHSNSWGAPGSNGRYDSFAQQVDTYMFNNPDFLAVFAAGNEGADKNKDGVIDEGNVSSPGTAKNALTVGASENMLLEGGIQKTLSELRNGKDNWGVEPLASSRLSDNPSGLAAFSSRGPTADGRIKPEIVAPGTNIVSARNKNPKAKPEDSWGIYDDNYLFMGGTSMATPIASGATVLVRQHLLQATGASSVSAALMKATLANAAKDLFPGQFGTGRGQELATRRPNNHEGFGRIDFNAMSAARAQFFDEREGLASSQEKSYSVTVTSADEALRVTLAYTDAPGSTSAAKTLVNDLDVKLISPSGAVTYPNRLSGKDATNNLEHIDLEASALSPGNYRVVVTGANVPQGKNGKQPFALVIGRY